MRDATRHERQYFFTGWRRVGVINTALIALLTVILITLLFISLYQLGEGWKSLSITETSDLFIGDCRTASRMNIGLHLGINIISSLVLASSNYFMQILSAPTRENVDKAHRQNKSLEIGVQSFKNLWYIHPSKTFFWFALALSSLPHHLFFNSSIGETRASTDFFLIVAADGFVNRQPYSLPGIGASLSSYNNIVDRGPKEQLLAAAARPIEKWEEISLDECVGRYDNPDIPLTTYRHVILVLSNPGEDKTQSWTTESARLDFPPENRTTVPNSLWLMTGFYRNDQWVAAHQNLARKGSLSPEDDKQNLFAGTMDLDPNTGLVAFVDSNVTLHADRCLSEPFTAPCELRVYNSILGIVCVANLLKLLLCMLTMWWFAKHDPLVTPGDAIESFIVEPDATTGGSKGALPPRQRVGRNLPGWVWILSYGVILGGLIAAFFYMGLALKKQPLSDSFFGPDSRNEEGAGGGSNVPLSDILTVNLSHLIFSVAYVVYNGLFTRMVSGLEWASYGVTFKSLRVSQRNGLQKSTYRLQLPYRWSIPLIAASAILHWLISNSIFLREHALYMNLPPYRLEGDLNQLITPPSGNGFFSSNDGVSISTKPSIGFSSMTILISTMVALVMALIPFVLAAVRLPGRMTLCKNDSAIMSAACHSITGKDGHDSNEHDELKRMVLGELKWAVVSHGADDSPARVAFGTRERMAAEPEVGKTYLGIKF